MMKFIGIVATFSIFVVATAQTGPSHGKMVACYGYTSQIVQYINADVARFEDTDLNLCSHLHAFFRSASNGREPWNATTSDDEDEYKQLIRLKLKYPHLKIMMIIPYHYIAQSYNNPVKYQESIKNATDFLLHFGFDGLDLIDDGDFKNQTARGVATVKDLRKIFKRFNLQLAVTWKLDVNSVHNYHALSEYIDYMHVIQPVDYYNNSEEKAIKVLEISNMKNRIDTVISMGIPPSKVIMDLYFSVFQFRKFSSSTFFTEWPYNQFCDSASNNETSIWERHYHDGASLVTIHNKNESSAVVGSVFQNTRSMANRARLAVKFNLAGVSAMFINYDDFRGKCGIDKDTFDDFKPTTKYSKDILKPTFPLLQSINEAFTATLYEIHQEHKQNDNSCGIFSFFCKFLPFC